MRASQSSRQRSPTTAGSGGWALIASIVVAQERLSHESRQPPM